MTDVYPIKDKVTGKSYEMPWDKPDPPSQEDVKAFILKQATPPTITDRAIGLGKSVIDAGKSAIDTVAPYAKKLVAGDYTTPEDIKEKPDQYLGPGMGAPFLRKPFDYLANKIDPPKGEGGYLRGLAAGSLQGIGDLVSGGADPRAVNIGRAPAGSNTTAMTTTPPPPPPDFDLPLNAPPPPAQRPTPPSINIARAPKPQPPLAPTEPVVNAPISRLGPAPTRSQLPPAPPPEPLPIMDGEIIGPKALPPVNQQGLPPQPDRPMLEAGKPPFYAGRKGVSQNLDDVKEIGLPRETATSFPEHEPGILMRDKTPGSKAPAPDTLMSKLQEEELKFLAETGDAEATAELKKRGGADKRSPFGEVENKRKPLSERLMDETGSINLFNSQPNPTKDATLKWVRKRNAAEMHGQLTAEKLNTTDKSQMQSVKEMVILAKQSAANKEFRDYLVQTGQIDPKSPPNRPGMWSFNPSADPKVKDWIKNHLSSPNKTGQAIADVTAVSKNLVMGAGVPGTPANIHGWNIARSEMMDQGFAKGTATFAKGIFNPSADRALLKQHRDLIPELMEHGFNWMDIEDHSATGSMTGFKGRLAAKGKAGEVAAKGLQLQQKAFEAPLFERHIPAQKLDMAARILKSEEPKIGREAALEKAAQISNDFYGGVETSLRNKDVRNVLRAITFAPDWFESRMKLGAKGVMAMVGQEDSRYAKALARSLVMRLTAEAPSILVGGGAAVEWSKRRPADVTNMPIGEAGEGKDRKNRELQTVGTASEFTRLPEVMAHKSIIEEDPRAAIGDILRDRLSPPMRMGIDVMMNQDAMGSPLSGKTRFGKKIKLGQGIANTAEEVARPMTPAYMQAIADDALGKISHEEAIAKALGLPLKYSFPQRHRF